MSSDDGDSAIHLFKRIEEDTFRKVKSGFVTILLLY